MTWSITFPQSGSVSKEDFLKSFPPRIYAGICVEEHEDGKPHLHLGIKLIKGITKHKLLEWIENKFPDDYKRINIQATRSLVNWIDYIKKEDPDFIEVGTLVRQKKKWCASATDIVIANIKMDKEEKKYLKSGEYKNMMKGRCLCCCALVCRKKL